MIHLIHRFNLEINDSIEYVILPFGTAGLDKSFSFSATVVSES